ncbi:MAG: helix-turn-helix domain-containing protein [Egibacteraceae bacterium]
MSGAAPMPDPWRPWHVQALRKVRNETQAELAEALVMTENSVWRWEHGDRRPTRPCSVRALNGLLEALTSDERERYYREVTRLLAPEGGADPGPGASLPTRASTHERDGMHRRDNLQAIAAVLAGALAGGFTWDRLAAATTVDAGLVADYEQGIDGLTEVYAKGNPSVMLPAAAGFADGLAPVLGRAPTHELGLRLSAVAVDAHIIAGVLAFDAGSLVLVHRHLAQAYHVAESSMDPLLRARSYTMLAKYIHSPLMGATGSARQAVGALTKAKALARHADGYTRAFLATSFAQEICELGDAGLCEWALEDAGRALDTATGDPRGLFSVRGLYGGGEQYIDGVGGLAAGLAGRSDEAERRLSVQVDQAVGVRQRMAGLCGLGTARVADADPEGACAALVEAADYGRVMGYAGRVARVRAVRAKMPPTWGALRCVVDLDERLRTPA